MTDPAEPSPMIEKAPILAALCALVWALIGGLVLTLCAGPAYGQEVPLPGPIEDAEVACIESPICNPASHAVVGTGLTIGISRATGMEARDARWITAGLQVAKEVRDGVKWGVKGHEADMALDLAMDAVAFLLAPTVDEWLFGED